MKKHLFLLFICTLCLFSQSQTLTQVYNEPVVGDIDYEYRLDTSGVGGSLPIGITGNNCTWDFTGLSTMTLAYLSYITPSASPNYTNYTGCNIVQKDGTSYTYMMSSNTPNQQVEIIGITLPLGTLNFSDPAILIRYPVSYGTSISDPVAGAFTSTITNGTASGSMTIDADGLGTLKLPMGVTLNNVLRVKNVLDLSLSAGLFSSKVKQYYYSYFSPTSKFPVLTINYSWVKLNFSGTPTINPVVDGNMSFFTAIPEIKLNEDFLVSVHPNPATNELNIEASAIGNFSHMELMNAQGQLVFAGPVTEHINVEHLARGFYMVTFRSGLGLVRKKVLLE